MSEQNDYSRRELFHVLGASMVLTASGVGVVTPAMAQHVHQELTEAKSLSGGPNYQPKSLSAHQFKTLRALGDLIIPADEHSPGASDAGAAEFIDFLCSRNSDLSTIFAGGLMWMDDYSQKHYRADFLDAKREQQTAMLDLLAYRKNATPEVEHGQHFFVWARNMVVDAFYTSPVGVKDIGFMGNAVLSSFSVPKEAVDYTMKRSPFANEA